MKKKKKKIMELEESVNVQNLQSLLLIMTAQVALHLKSIKPKVMM